MKNSENRPIVGHVIAGDLWGGKEAQVSIQTTYFRAQGENVFVLMFNESTVAEQYRSSDIPVVVAEENLGMLSLIRKSKQLISKIGPEILVAHGYKEAFVTGIVSYLLSIPMVVVFHGRAEPYPGMRGIKMKLYEAIALFVARFRARTIVTVSSRLREDLGLVANLRTRVIFNAVSEESPVSEDVSLPEKSILMVGRLFAVKRFDLAIRAFGEFLKGSSENDEYTLQIIGTGPAEAELRALTQALNLDKKVYFLGFKKNITAFIRKARVFLMSSDSEGIPTVLLEAVHAGLPIVATSVGGIPEVMSLFPEYPVYLARKGDILEISKGLQAASQHELVVKEGFRQVLEAHFSPQAMSRQYQSLYEEIVRGG